MNIDYYDLLKTGGVSLFVALVTILMNNVISPMSEELKRVNDRQIAMEVKLEIITENQKGKVDKAEFVHLIESNKEIKDELRRINSKLGQK